MRVIDTIVETANRTFDTAEGITVVSPSAGFVVRFAKRSYAEKRRQRYDAMLSNPPVHTFDNMVLYQYIGPDVVDTYETCITDDEKISLAMRLAIDIYKFIRSLHDRLIVHLDIKPDNICVDANGEFHLIDGGGATTIDTEGVSTDPSFQSMAACRHCVWTAHAIKDLRVHDYNALAETILSMIPTQQSDRRVTLLLEITDALQASSRDCCDRLVSALAAF